MVAEVANYLNSRFLEAVDFGLNKVVIDVDLLASLPSGISKLRFQAMEICRDLEMPFALVGNPQIIPFMF